MNVKFIATAAVSACFGAAAAWAITADRAETKSQQMTEDYEALQTALREKLRENVALRAELDDKTEELEAVHAQIDEETGFSESDFSPGEDAPENVSDVAPHVEPTVRDERDDTPTDEELDAQRDALRAQIRAYIPSEEDERVFMEEQGGPVIASTKYDPPFVISQPDYAVGEEGMYYKNITMKYYPKDQILLDEMDEVVEDVDRYVGWRSLDQFGGESGDPNIVYVRNRNMEVDFEVERADEDETLPLHVQYGMPQIEFKSQKAAGKIRLPEEEM